MIRMSHPKHGFHIVYNNSAVAEHEKLGWSVHIEPQHVVVDAAEDNNIEDLKAAYFAKFGKKPHHLMKLENIQKALDDNG